MYEKAGYCGAILFLGYLSKYDIRWKRIPAKAVYVFGSIALLYFLLKGEIVFSQLVFLMLPGALLLFLAKATKEKIGYGDGAAALVLGFFTGGLFCMEAVCLGFVLAGGYSVYCFVRKGEKKVPFIPFLLAAMEVMLFYA